MSWPGDLNTRWWVACTSRELRSAPLARTVLGTPLVLFRDAHGAAAALVDRCPHRGFPLSAGRVREGSLQCAYHGWTFDAAGGCVAVPGLPAGRPLPAVESLARPVIERDGLAWTCPGGLPREGDAPFELQAPRAGESSAMLRAVVDSTLEAAIENVLDVPHTAFVHHGLFRKQARSVEVDVVTRRAGGRVEAEYFGEPGPSGFMGKLLAPKASAIHHVDRFVSPCVAEVIYEAGGGLRIHATHFFTPESVERTRIVFVIRWRTTLPVPIVRVLVHLAGWRLTAQDGRALAALSANARRFAARAQQSTELDALGPHVGALLRGAERGEHPDPTPREWRARMTL